MMNVKVKGYDKCKFDATSNKIWEVEYKDIKGYEVKKISDEEILEETNDTDSIDEYGEYLIITLQDGTATFRNSHVDMFRI